MNLLIDNLRIIFIFLPIPDKRNFVRTNKNNNSLAHLIVNAENVFWQNMPVYTTSYGYNLKIKNPTTLEKLTMEMLYYGYPHIMPRSYINNYNRLFREKYIYFHAGIIGNKEIIHILASINDDYFKKGDILSGRIY